MVVKKNRSLEFVYPIGLIIHLSYQLFFIIDIPLPKTPNTCSGACRTSYSIFPPKWRWWEELLNSKWPHSHEEIVMRNIFSVKNCTEETLAYKIKCKWENQVIKGVLKFWEEGELDCMCGR